MALLHEKDPRWVVEDRADGQNVGQWHWTERDCTKVGHPPPIQITASLPYKSLPASHTNHCRPGTLPYTNHCQPPM